MDYCDCGRQAEGRCTRTGEFLCLNHLWKYPHGLLWALVADSSEPVFLTRPSAPPLRVEYPGNLPTLCPACYESLVDEILPTLSERLSLGASVSIEKAAVRILQANLWDTDRGGVPQIAGRSRPIGPALMGHVFGHRPVWAFERPSQMMGRCSPNCRGNTQSRLPPSRSLKSRSTKGSSAGGGKDLSHLLLSPRGSSGMPRTVTPGPRGLGGTAEWRKSRTSTEDRQPAP